MSGVILRSLFFGGRRIPAVSPTSGPGDPLTRPATAEENAGAVHPLPQGGEGRNRCGERVEVRSRESRYKAGPHFKYNIDMISFQVGKFLVIVGVLLVAVGLFMMTASKSSFFGLGRLPGDIVYRGKNVQFYFPIVTCLILSVALTLVFWLVSYLTRR
jgi:uncharacterized membrane protein YidH (DUF202 family)